MFYGCPFTSDSVVRKALPLLCLSLILLSSPALSAVTELHVGDKLARADLLKPGTHRYIRYTITADGHRNAIDIWTREISFETLNGRRVLRIHQQWDEAAPPSTLVQDAWFDPDTLRPLTHIRKSIAGGKTNVAGCRFLADKIVGMDELADNARKGFSQDSSEPAYDWEIDMEMMQALPLAPDYAASINFYDPGDDPPARYVYSVTGSQTIAGPDGSGMDCWIVTIEFPTPKGVVKRHFWLDKKTQVLVREETFFLDGSILVKSLLAPEKGDAGM